MPLDPPPKFYINHLPDLKPKAVSPKASNTRAPRTSKVGFQNRETPIPWVLPPLSNSWIMNIVCLYIALGRTPNIDGYRVGAVPNQYP